MTWKTYYPQNDKQIEAYFVNAVHELLGPLPKASVQVNDGGLTLDIQQGRRNIFNFYTTVSGEALIVHNLDTQDVKSNPTIATGKNVSGLALKTGIAKAHICGANRIVAEDLTFDGNSFWPHQAALPIPREGTACPLFLRRFASAARNLFSGTGWTRYGDGIDPKLAKAVVENALAHPLRTFQLLSQIRAPNEHGPFFVNFFQQNGALFTNHTIFLGEPVTRAILEKRLGPLPPFPDTSPLTGREPPVYNRFLGLGE